ncbi:MAG: S-layer homology domain-containing protein [Firmicutes bacterium]|nr:S-layer homology domain-containing protein [Bacillota bacterium]
MLLSHEKIRKAAYKKADTSAQANLGDYTDESTISSWAREALSWAVASGLMKGVTETTLDPQGNATRAQAAVLMQRLCREVL